LQRNHERLRDDSERRQMSVRCRLGAPSRTFMASYSVALSSPTGQSDCNT
jgi:hypothetical protein